MLTIQSTLARISYLTNSHLISPYYNLFSKTYNKNAGRKPITPHGLRHTHATLLLSQGIRAAIIKVVAKRLGNTPQMILDIYGHTFLDLEEESVQLFSESLNGTKTGANSEEE